MDINQPMDVKEAKKIYDETQGKIAIDSQSYVSLRHINKIYPKGNQAVYDFSFDISKGEFVALVGPSGCGKSTTLRMIAGLEEISSGELYLNGVLANYLPSKDRDIAMVFQSYALYPQLNVYDNIAFGLKIRKTDKEIIKDKVFKAADILDLGDYLDRYPRELSGGQMQRVALGRAIVRDASIFLMDEPLSNLDAKLRVSMRSEIVKIHQRLGATTIYVTHDQIEAMTMADKIVVMNKGFIQQTGRPMDIYDHPNNLFVATFIGSPAMNLFPMTYQENKLLFTDGKEIPVPQDFQEKQEKFYQHHIQEVNDILQRYTPEKPTEALTYLLENRSHLLTENVKAEAPKKAKKGFFKVLSSLFKAKKSAQADTTDYTRKELEKRLADYRTSLSEKTGLLAGIRCEDILTSRSSQDEVEVSFAIEQLEVLGSEYILYGKIGDYEAKLKSQGRCSYQAKQVIPVFLRVDKIHFFDTVSGQNVTGI